jgi:hypothetical protein
MNTLEKEQNTRFKSCDYSSFKEKVEPNKGIDESESSRGVHPWLGFWFIELVDGDDSKNEEKDQKNELKKEDIFFNSACPELPAENKFVQFSD